jgi:putative motility protein YjfB-like
MLMTGMIGGAGNGSGFNHNGWIADRRVMSSISSTASSGMAQAQLAQEVGIKVAVKTLNAAKAQGEAAVSLLQAAASLQDQALGSLEPYKGQSLDVTV